MANWKATLARGGRAIRLVVRIRYSSAWQPHRCTDALLPNVDGGATVTQRDGCTPPSQIDAQSRCEPEALAKAKPPRSAPRVAGHLRGQELSGQQGLQAASVRQPDMLHSSHVLALHPRLG